MYHLSVPRRLAAGPSGITPRARVSLALVLLRAVRASLAAVRVLVWTVVFVAPFRSLSGGASVSTWFECSVHGVGRRSLPTYFPSPMENSSSTSVSIVLDNYLFDMSR